MKILNNPVFYAIVQAYVVIPNSGMRPIETIQSIHRSMRGKRKTPMDVLAGTVETIISQRCSIYRKEGVSWRG